MIPGKTFTSNGITSDDKYIYYANIDLNRFGFYGKNNNSLVYQANHRPHLQLVVVDKSKAGAEINARMYTDDANIKHQQGLELPFRHPMMYSFKDIELQSSDVSNMQTYNPDFLTTLFTTTNGSMREFTIDRSLKQKLDDATRIYYNARRGLYTENVIASSPNSYQPGGIFQMFGGQDYDDHYPTNLSIYAKNEVDGRYLYISYVYTYRSNSFKTSFFLGENHFGKFGADKSNLKLGAFDYGNSTNRALHAYTKPYNNMSYDYRINVPMVTRYKYNDTNDVFEYDSVSYPFADNNRIIDPTRGTYDYNLRVVPYNTVQFGSFGSLDLPSSNKCVSNSYMDYTEERLVCASVYESQDENTFPNRYTLRVSYHNTGGALSLVPTASDSTPDLQILLRSYKQFNSIDNINKVDITKWQDNYIISISYDSKSGTNDPKHGTLLMKVPAGPASPIIAYFTNTKNAAFGGVQGLSSGSMT